MARLDFGGDGTQAILDLTTGDLLRNGTGGVFYASLEATTPLVDITSDVAGTTFLDEATTNTRGVLNRFYGPDEVTQIAVDFGAGRFLIDSNTGRKNGMGAAKVARDALTAAQDALTTTDLGTPGGPAVLGDDGRLPRTQLPTDIGTGGGGAALDTLVVGGKSPVNGVLDLRPGDIGAAKATDLKAVATTGSATDLTGVLPKTSLPTLAKADVGLSAVDNTADTAKPVSTAQKAALDAKAPTSSPSFTGTVKFNGTTIPLPADMPVSTAQAAALAAKAPVANPSFTGVLEVNDVPLPVNPVGADVQGLQFVTSTTVDPKTLPDNQVAILPSDRVMVLPATAPATEQVVTVTPTGVQSTRSLTSIGTGGTTASSVQTTARRVLAGAAGQDRTTVLAAHPNPPTVTVVAGSTSTITGAVRIPLKRRDASFIDVGADPHFDFPGARPNGVKVFQTTLAYADYLTGGSSQNRRDYWRERTVYSGAGRVDFIVQARTGTLSYRLWVDGMPLTLDQQKFTATAGSNYLIQLDFGTTALGPRTIEVEVNDPTFGGAWVGPTDSISRYRTPRATMVGFGDSHTAGANGVGVGDTWLTWAARILGTDPYNMAIGGSGFLQTAGGGTTAPNFRARITPDVVSVKPDLVVFPGGYNDVGVSTAAAIGTEAQACYQALRDQLPNAVVVAVGPFWQSHTVTASLKAQDDAQRAAAVAVGIPYISYIDPLGLTQAGGAPAWVASTAYAVGDTAVSASMAWKCTVAHTSGTAFDATKWRATSFVTGTGKSTTLKNDGNADVIVSSDGIHETPQGHKIHGYWLASELTRVLRDLAA